MTLGPQQVQTWHMAVVIIAAAAVASGGCGGEASGDSKADALVLPRFDSGTIDSGPAGGPDGDTAAGGCPGAAHCPCTANAGCDGALCLDTAAGKRCAAPCAGGGGCQAGERCTEVDAGADKVFVCVEVAATYCDPCQADAACRHPGAPDGRCVRHGAAGSFCGLACASDDDCPAGHSCADGEAIDGSSVRQCRPAAGALCACSTAAMAQQKATACAVTGADGASCPGTRACLSPGGLGACTGKAPGPEVCDGSDNDCDGATDEDAAGCDDGDPCSADGCLAGVCQHSASGAACDDGDGCSEGDACAPGPDGKAVCAGKPKPCDDGNPCTADACSAGACAHSASAGPCDDGDACTTGDDCAAGSCQGVAKTCDDGNACTADTCDAASGLCNNAVAAGSSCDDGDACTAGDVCAPGADSKAACQAGAAVTCDDANPCTIDGCAAASGCTATVQVGHSEPCYDGGAGTKGVGVCGGGTATCQDNGGLGPCLGQVVPSAELCKGNADEDCDGATDEGCAVGPPQARWRQVGVVVRGPAAGGAATAYAASAGPAGRGVPIGAAPAVSWGWYQVLQGLGW